MKTSIVILTHNHLEVTKLCIESIRKYTKPQNYELIIVDNASTDGTVEWLEQQQDIRTIYNQENKGFPAGCNQGMRIATGENIMLLNNDVVVTEGWLDNLITCLYSQENIGAVGPVTNSCTYYQAIPVTYKNLEEMQVFAKEHNQCNPALWEERLKLIGYAFLFKRIVYMRVGELDEIFTPGNFEDDDFSFRIRDAGFKLMLCRDTFIHHFGSVSFSERPLEYQNLLLKNESKFIQKWGFDSQRTTFIRNELLPHIRHKRDEDFALLEVGSGCGGTLLQIKNSFSKSQLYGYDSNHHAANQATSFAQIGSGNWDEFHVPFKGKMFDYIVINNVIEKVENPALLLKKAQSLLKTDGVLVLISKNVSHIKIIDRLLKGDSPFSHDEKRYYTLNELIELVKAADFMHFEYTGQPTWLGEREQDLLNKINSLGHAEMEKYYLAYEFILRMTGSKKEISFKEKMNELKHEKNVSVHLQELQQIGIDTVITQVMAEAEDRIALLNLLAVKNFEYEYYEDVIPYLQKAYELDERNMDTLHNLAAVMEFSGEIELAKWYSSMIDEVSFQEVPETKIIIEKWDKQKLKFILRRIEFGVLADESVEQVLLFLHESKVTSGEIIDVILRDMINKVELLNLLAGLCFENDIHEEVIPFLQAAYDIDPTGQHTLYNLGFIMHAYGERELALSFVEKIEQPDENALELLAAIKGA